MGAIDTAKEIAGLVLKYNDVDLIRRITVLEAEVRGIVQQIAEKDEAIEKLKRAMELKGKMVCEHSAYYQVDEQGNKTAGPFCTKCFDSEYATRRLVQSARPNGGGGHDREWVECPTCRVPFRSKNIGRYLQTH